MQQRDFYGYGLICIAAAAGAYSARDNSILLTLCLLALLTCAGYVLWRLSTARETPVNDRVSGHMRLIALSSTGIAIAIGVAAQRAAWPLVGILALLLAGVLAMAYVDRRTGSPDR
jgi:hypothetical protein